MEKKAFAREPTTLNNFGATIEYKCVAMPYKVFAEICESIAYYCRY